MADVTLIPDAIESGDLQAADDLLPVVYQELRRLAAHRLFQEKPGQTLQATAPAPEAIQPEGPGSAPLRQPLLAGGGLT